MSGQDANAEAALNNRSIVPTSPFEIQATQDLLQQRIENGEITQADVDLVKQGYRWMSISATVGTVTCGVGTLLALKRRRPPINIGLRLLGASAMGMMGSFIGFTIGGAAATMEVERNMADAPRKMQVFAEIAQDTRRQLIESRAQQIKAKTGQSPFPKGLPPTRAQRASGELSEPTWDPEGQEKAVEAERERELGLAGSSSGTSTSRQPEASAGRDEIARATKGTWDKIRQETYAQAGARGSATPAAADGMASDPRSKEQREFDEMLEKERQGAAGEDKWA